jgi:hypothetical protein
MSATKPAKSEGGYLAKNCPARVQWDVIRPCEPLPTSPFLQRLFTQGMDFEREVFIEIAALHPDAEAIVLRGPDNREAREQQTLNAMRAGVEIIVGGRLPVDVPGRKVGEPDLLIRAEGGGYRAVDVKHHKTIGGQSTVTARASSLAG